MSMAFLKRNNGYKRSRLTLILFATVQVADIITTNRALALPGRMEVNPLMAQAMAHLGSAWWVPKLAIIGCALLAARWVAGRHSRSLMPACYAAIAFTLAVVASNIAHL